MTEDFIEALEETARWHARDVQYWRGPIDRITLLMPTFELRDFVADHESAVNPYLKSVVRLPVTKLEKPMPVAAVSNSYGLVQHYELVAHCLRGLELAGVNTRELDSELGMTELGEWMNLRLYLPSRYDQDCGDGHPLRLRLECFNSVDGSYRLVAYFGWLRFVCANGMVIGETKAEVREVHNNRLDLHGITLQIKDAMFTIDQSRRELESWTQHPVRSGHVASWADGVVNQAWGKKAACRAYHICTSGHDVDLVPPFTDLPPTRKPIKLLGQVPGATSPVATAYDASQALTWLASKRTDPDERLKWMLDVPGLIDGLIGVAQQR